MTLQRNTDRQASSRLAAQVRADMADGRLAQAETVCAEWLRQLPDDPDGLLLSGALCVRTGRWKDAEAFFRRGCRLYPRSPGFFGNLGRMYINTGRLDLAVDPLEKAVLLQPGPKGREDRRMLARALGQVRYGGHTAQSAQAVLACLEDRTLDPRFMADAWLSLLMNDPAMAEARDLFSLESYEAFAARASLPFMRSLCENALLRAGLTRVTLQSPVLERGMTHVRRWMLDHEAARGESVDFLCALGHACFMNEYLFPCSPAESEALEALADRARREAAGFALLACYRPLWRDPRREDYLASARKHPAARALARAAIAEPLEESRMAEGIQALTPIDDAVSNAVRDQYERNPYPRWNTVGVAPVEPSVQAMARGRSILIAGCGTGREAAGFSMLYPQAEILAVDLSRASLAYGIRQCREAGCRNLTFGQGDILRLPGLGRRFDLIVSSGVLHHMRDPAAGLEILSGLLAPGGVLHVSLYSAVARRVIEEIRAWIAAEGFKDDPDGIKRFRQTLFALDGDHPFRAAMIHSHDLYSLSGCRDLLFHVEEHAFTLPEIEALASDLGLILVRTGVSNPAHVAAYKTRFPDDPDMASFANWAAYENDHPAAFAGMYSLWLRPAGNEPDMEWVMRARGI